MTILLFSNQAQTTLAYPVSNSSTTVVVAAGTASYFPNPGDGEAFKLTLVSAVNNLINEIVLVTAVEGDVLTVVRAQEGTVARAWKTGDFAVNLMTAGTGSAFTQQYGLENGLYSAQFINMETDTGQINQLPVQANDIANKQYVDSYSQGAYKAECMCATTEAITLYGLQTIDTYTVQDQDRVLVKNQGDPALNGIYVATTTDWYRAGDMNVWDQVPGAFTFVVNGDINDKTGWVCIADPDGVIDVTLIVWTQVSGVGTYTAGTGLTLTGTQFSITNTGVTAASYGTASSVPTVVLNAQGQATSAVNMPISISPGQINSAIPNSSLAHSSITLGSDTVSLGGTISTLHGVNISGSDNTLSAIPNSALTYSSITLNGNTISLGGSATITAAAPYALTIGTGLTGTSYNGSAAVTVAIGDVGTSGTYGSAGSVPVFTTNAQGQVSGVTNTAIQISTTQVTGLGTMATQNANNVSITGGSISGVALTLDSLDSTPIGANTASTVRGTTITATTGFYGSGANLTSIPNSALNYSSITINGNSVSLGGSTTVTATNPYSVTFNNSGTGDASGTTFDGSVAKTISYNTIGAPSTTGTNASGTWNIAISGSSYNTPNMVLPLPSDPSWAYGSFSDGSNVFLQAKVWGGGDIHHGFRVWDTYTSAALMQVDGTGNLTATTFTGAGTGLTGTASSLSIGGNAGTVTNGVYTTGSYADPTWISSIAGSKVSGNISGSAGSVAHALTIGSGLSGTSYNGSSDVTIALSSVGTANTYGSASSVPVLTTNAYGQVSGVTNTPIAISYTAVSGLGTAATMNAGVANGVATLDGAGTLTSSQIPASLLGALKYQGAWNASTNSPTLTSSVGTQGYYYVVSVAGTTNLNGITDWQIGDWAIFNGSIWQKIDNTDSVTSVNGYTGTVVLGYSDVGAPSTSGTNATGTWNISVTGNAATVTNGVYTTGSYADPTWLTSLATTKLSGTVTNAQLANSTISGVSLGSNLYALTIGSGLSGTSYNGSAGVTITNTAPDQVVSFTNGTGISVTGTYPNFTITNTAPDQVVSLTGGGTTVITGSYPNFTITSNDAYTGTVTSVATGTGLTGGPITTTGTVSFAVPAVGTWAATPSSANLAAAMTDETGSGSLVFANGPTLSGPTIDGTNPYVQFNNGVSVTNAAGRMWYNGSTGSLNFGMGGGNITQQVGEELFIYGKATATIADSPLQIVYQSGTVGASGVIEFKPTIAGLTNGDLIVGVATEPITSGNFGRVTAFGVIHGITSDGSAYGETWHDNDTIWYDPVTGNPTNVKPSAPNIKVSVGTIINAGSGGSGSFQVELNHGSVLGGTDSNVQFGTLGNGDLIQYSTTSGYWTNVSQQVAAGIQLARLATSATVTSGSQFFTSTARPFLTSGHLYRIEYNLIFTKNTAGTVTFGFSNSTSSNFTPINAVVSLIQQGYGTTATGNIYATGAATASSQASFSLSDTTGYTAKIVGYVIPAADMRLQLTVTDSAGTVTSQLGSNFIVTDLGSSTTIGNIG